MIFRINEQSSGASQEHTSLGLWLWRLACASGYLMVSTLSRIFAMPIKHLHVVRSGHFVQAATVLIMHIMSRAPRQLELPHADRQWPAQQEAWQSKGLPELPAGQTCGLDDRTAELTQHLAATQYQLKQAQVRW